MRVRSNLGRREKSVERNGLCIPFFETTPGDSCERKLGACPIACRRPYALVRARDEALLPDAADRPLANLCGLWEARRNGQNDALPAAHARTSFSKVNCGAESKLTNMERVCERLCS